VLINSMAKKVCLALIHPRSESTFILAFGHVDKSKVVLSDQAAG
jgi:hypothetical protein